MTTEERDLLAEWLKLGREVLERYYPGTRYAILVARQGDDLPDVQLPIIPSAPATSASTSHGRV